MCMERLISTGNEKRTTERKKEKRQIQNDNVKDERAMRCTNCSEGAYAYTVVSEIQAGGVGGAEYSFS